MTATWLTGPALDVVRTLPDNSVDLVATSPPFLALRNYNDVPGQWGAEATPAEFLANLLELAVELRRVLTPTGSIAVELGDTYSGSGGAGGDYDRAGMRAGQPKVDGSAQRRRDRAADTAAEILPRRGRPSRGYRDRTPGWPPAKSLTGVPTLFAWSLAYGRNLLDPAQTLDPWRVRNVIVWARANPSPGQLADKVRPATSYITVACTSERRWFDLDAVRVPNPRVDERPRVGSRALGLIPGSGSAAGNPDRITRQNPAGAPPTDYWSDDYDGDATWLVNTQPSGLAHYAMWPAKLAERLVLAMCPREVCRSCGHARRRITEADCSPAPTVARAQRAGSDRGRLGLGATGGRHVEQRQVLATGWSDCGHGDYRPGVVLDPFAGTFTTGHVAEIHGRDAIGIDLDPINATLRDRRRDEVRRNLLDVAPEVPGQLTLEALL